MKINKEKTKLLFDKTLGKEYYEFLSERKIVSESYFKALQKCEYGYLEDNVLTIDGWEYSVRYILGASNEAIYDIIRDNQIYGILPEEGTIVAILEGDDYLFLKPNDLCVYFFCRDTEKETMVCKDYYDLENIIFGEN